MTTIATKGMIPTLHAPGASITEGLIPMIAQLQGEHFTITEVSKLLPGRPNVSTIWRWVTKGCRGQQLATIRIGGINYIAKSELERFLHALQSDGGNQ